MPLSLQMRHGHYRPHYSSYDTGHSFSLASMLLASTIGNSDLEDNAQSILDDHVSHVWNSSGATPSRSPGFRTPDRPRHDLTRQPQAAQKNRDCCGRSFAPIAAAHGRMNHKDGRVLSGDAPPIQTGYRYGQQRQLHHHHHQPKESHGWPHLTSDSDAHFVAKHHSPVLNRSATSWTNAVDASAKLSSNARKNADTSNRSVDANDEQPNTIEENGQNDLQR